VVCLPADDSEMIFGSEHTFVAADGAFELKCRPGRSRIVIRSVPPTLQVRSISLNDLNIRDGALELRPNESAGPVSVVLTSNVTTIQAAITDRRGQASSDGTVILFPIDLDGRATDDRKAIMARPDQNGGVSISAIRPGDYYIVALDDVDRDRDGDPEYLRLLADVSTRIAVPAGGQVSVTLPLRSTPQ
jgi:hypothetical protein